MVSFNSRISPRTSTVILRERSPRATAVVTLAMLRTCAVRLPHIAFTESVRSFQVPATPGTIAWPPSLPSVPTSRATRVTSEAKERSWSTIVLMASFSCRISPRTSTVIFLERSPLATAIVTSAMLRTWPVRLLAMELTLSVRSFQTPVTSGTCAWPPSLPSVPTSRATRVTSEVNTLSCLIMVLTMVAGHSYREISTSHRLQCLKQLLRRVRLSVGVGLSFAAPPRGCGARPEITHGVPSSERRPPTQAVQSRKISLELISQHQTLRAVSKQGKKVSFSKRLGSRNQPGTEQFRAGTLVPQRLKNVGNSGTSFASEFREGVRQLSPSDPMEPNWAVAQAQVLNRAGWGRLLRKGKPHCRFGAGLRGGAGLSAAAGWRSNFRVSLMAARLTSKSDRRPSSISAPDFLLKLSASSRIDFTLPSKSSALPSARPGTMLSVFVIALSIPAKPLSALRMMLSMSSPLLAREPV